MELEIEIPIWWVYLAFPTGFLIMAVFALELVLSELLAMLNGKILAHVHSSYHILNVSSAYVGSNFPCFGIGSSALLSLDLVCHGQH